MFQDEHPPPLPPRWQAPAPARLCHSVCEDDDDGLPVVPTRSYTTLDRTSTFTRPRKMSDSRLFIYPSPMHAVLMQYPNSDTQSYVNKHGYMEHLNSDTQSCVNKHGYMEHINSDTQSCVNKHGYMEHLNSDTQSCVNKHGYLETMFPAGGEEPKCGHCYDQQKAFNIPDSKGKSHQSRTDLSQAPSQTAGQTSPITQQLNVLTRKSPMLQSNKQTTKSRSKSKKDSRSPSNLSEEGYFSCCSDNSLNGHFMSSSISNDNCFDESISQTPNHQSLILSNDGIPNMYCFHEEVENAEQLFVLGFQ